ncbi:MAG: SDR family NAD(P)-dependent oxidoreductase [Actinobacteria bacterium]|nr:SDR family NAD(P)-dependent oxidoreductase [Actinomycetota bacterium]MCA1721559.1 SDR family NAD(P)-dependent oxidoreductase [Actinomycetota bacterium]
MTLRGRVGVVTGASRGIGREIATALAAEGMSLLLLARTGAAVRQLAEQLTSSYDVKAFPAAIDVADPEAVDRVVLHAEQHLGPVDLLVNNAARIETTERLFWQADPGEMWSVVETNLRGPLLLTRALLPPMVDRGHGRVVNIASRARAATQTGTYTGYAVSKRALSVLTASLAGPLAGTGVVVLDVLPGLVRTELTESMPVWRDRPEQVWDDVAATARVVVDVARGRYDDRAGTVLDAPALAGG